MTTAPNLRDDLLKQNGQSRARAADVRNRILARDRARVRCMKWIAGVAWSIFLIVFILAALAEAGRRYALFGLTTDQMVALLPEYNWFVPMAIIITQALFIIAVAATFALHVHSRTLTMHQIQARLAAIEEHLKRLAEGK